MEVFRWGYSVLRKRKNKDAHPYGWNYMIDTAEYMNQVELENIGTVTISTVMGGQETELIEEYHIAGNTIKNIPEISVERCSCYRGYKFKIAGSCKKRLDESDKFASYFND